METPEQCVERLTQTMKTSYSSYREFRVYFSTYTKKIVAKPLGKIGKIITRQLREYPHLNAGCFPKQGSRERLRAEVGQLMGRVRKQGYPKFKRIAKPEYTAELKNLLQVSALSREKLVSTALNGQKADGAQLTCLDLYLLNQLTKRHERMLRAGFSGPQRKQALQTYLSDQINKTRKLIGVI